MWYTVCMNKCIVCHTEPPAPYGKTGKCYRCSRGHPQSEKQKAALARVRKTQQYRLTMSKSKMGGKNPNWKGDNIKSMTALHTWVRRHLPKPELCECCNLVPPLDLANKGVYNRDFSNWEYLCRKCHMVKDGRMNNLKQNRRS